MESGDSEETQKGVHSIHEETAVKEAAAKEAEAKEAAAKEAAVKQATAKAAVTTEATDKAIADQMPKPRPRPTSEGGISWRASTHEERMAVAKIRYRVQYYGMEAEEW